MADLGPRLQSAVADRYTIERELGRGGMATVFLAQDLKHHRHVAIKVLRPEIANAIGAERFLREIETAAQLTHPHILPLFDSGEADGLLYYVMPYVAGESLRDRLDREKQLPLNDALEIARHVAAALAHAHSRGIIHRDIKPANIMLEGDEAVVADFGIARAIRSAGGPQLTDTGITLGTPAYMSPEQAAGEPTLDGRSDLYSLACVLYETLAGEPPFLGASAQSIIAKHLSEPPPSLRVVRPNIPLEVERAILTALAKIPADRFLTTAEFATALSGAGEPAVPTSRWNWRRYAWPMLAGVAVLSAWLIGTSVVGGNRFRLTEQDWIFVADFQGPEDDPALARAVRDLVVAKLNQSQFIRTVPVELVTNARRDAGISDTALLDADLARELAARTSVRVILTGSINRLGQDAYSIVLNVIDVEEGRPILSESAPAVDQADELVRTVGELGATVRMRLGERRELVEAEQPLMRVRTPSFEAFRKFSEAIEIVRRGNWAGSNVVLREALAADSAFALAWAVMAMNYMTSRKPDSAAAAFERALQYPDRLSDADLYRLRGDIAYNIDYDLQAAVLWYDAYLQTRPNSISARNNRALYLSAMGRHEEAADEFAAASMIDPLHKGPRQIQLLNLMAELVVLGRLDSARSTASKLTGPPAQYARLLLLVAEDQWGGVVDTARTYASDPSTEPFLRLPATTSWASGLAAIGRVGEAAGVLADAAAGVSGAQARWYRHALLFLSVVSGQQLVTPTARPAADTTAGGELLFGLEEAFLGDTTTAQAQLRKLEARSEVEQRRLGFGMEFLEAAILARKGRWPQALDLLREAASVGEHDPFSLDRVGSLSIWWMVAHAFAEVGNVDSAIATLERVVGATGLPPAHYSLRGFPQSFAQRQLALWNQELGRTEEARSRWRAFSQVFISPDSTMTDLLEDPSGRL